MVEYKMTFLIINHISYATQQKAFALASGIFWRVSLLLATIWVMFRDGGNHLALLNQFYIGYDITALGAVLGLVYGFIDGFICGWIFAWLYNKLCGCREKKDEKAKE